MTVLTGRRSTIGSLAAALCVAMDLVALFAVVSAYRMRPDGPWDDDVLAAIQVSAFTGGLVAVLGVSLRVLPVVLGRLRCWWLPAPLVLFLAAVVRFWWISAVYPVD